MIVQERSNGQLLCIRQTSHALMAAQFCRHWGNGDFAQPAPYAPVMLGITQHDNGWYEWEEAAQLRADGYPMDFMHGPVAEIKRQLWQTGIDRVYAQHPYAGLLIAQHATRLYAGDVAQMEEGAEKEATVAFIAAQQGLIDTVRTVFAGDAQMQSYLDAQRVEANTRLLQFGDSASLQLCVPWDSPRTFTRCPVDFAGTEIPIEMHVHDSVVMLSPWPYGVDAFTVSMHGHLLDRRSFANHRAYQAALAAAPLLRLEWQVQR